MQSNDKNIDSLSSVYKIINKNKSKFEKFINNSCKIVFDNIKKKVDLGETDDFDYWKDEYIKLINNGQVPYLDYINYNTDYYEIQLKYSFNINDEWLYFQDELVKILNKSSKEWGLRFSSEDYNGIYIIPKK